MGGWARNFRLMEVNGFVHGPVADVFESGGDTPTDDNQNGFESLKFGASFVERRQARSTGGFDEQAMVIQEALTRHYRATIRDHQALYRSYGRPFQRLVADTFRSQRGGDTGDSRQFDNFPGLHRGMEGSRAVGFNGDNRDSIPAMTTQPFGYPGQQTATAN